MSPSLRRSGHSGGIIIKNRSKEEKPLNGVTKSSSRGKNSRQLSQGSEKKEHPKGANPQRADTIPQDPQEKKRAPEKPDTTSGNHEDEELDLRIQVINTQSIYMAKEIENARLEKKIKELEARIEEHDVQRIENCQGGRNEGLNLRTNEKAKGDEGAQEKLISTLALKEIEIHTLRERIKIMERELANAAIGPLEEGENIDSKNKNPDKVHFEKTAIGFVVYDTDKNRMEFLGLLKEKARYESGIRIDQFYIRKNDEGKQFAFAYLKDKDKIDAGDKCITCGRIFKDGRYGSISSGPSGVGASTEHPIIKYGPICGIHRMALDKNSAPLNFFIKRR